MSSTWRLDGYELSSVARVIGLGGHPFGWEETRRRELSVGDGLQWDSVLHTDGVSWVIAVVALSQEEDMR